MASDSQDLDQVIYKLISEIVGDDDRLPAIAEMRPDQSLSDDLGLDSLDLLDLIYAIEVKFDVKVPDDHINRIRTLGDVNDSVIELMSIKSKLND